MSMYGEKNFGRLEAVGVIWYDVEDEARPSEGEDGYQVLSTKFRESLPIVPKDYW